MSRRQTGWLAAALIMGVFGIWSILGMVADIAAFRGGACLRHKLKMSFFLRKMKIGSRPMPWPISRYVYRQ